ncbi:MAG: hypothetical protein AVDCRST_MAG06-859, partial [uncultured Nocardioides sp.]
AHGARRGSGGVRAGRAHPASSRLRHRPVRLVLLLDAERDVRGRRGRAPSVRGGLHERRRPQDLPEEPPGSGHDGRFSRSCPGRDVHQGRWHLRVRGRRQGERRAHLSRLGHRPAVRPAAGRRERDPYVRGPGRGHRSQRRGLLV